MPADSLGQCLGPLTHHQLGLPGIHYTQASFREALSLDILMFCITLPDYFADYTSSLDMSTFCAILPHSFFIYSYAGVTALTSSWPALVLHT